MLSMDALRALSSTLIYILRPRGQSAAISGLRENFCFSFFRRRFLREGILAGDERQAGTGIPFHSNLPHIVHIGNRAFCTGRWGLWVVHGMQGDAGSCRVLPPKALHLFPCRPLVQMIISFLDFPDFGIAFSFVPVLAVPCAAVLPAVLPAGASPSQWNGVRYSGTA